MSPVVVAVYVLLAVTTVVMVAWSVRSFMMTKDNPMMTPDQAQSLRMERWHAKHDAKRAERAARKRGDAAL